MLPNTPLETLIRRCKEERDLWDLVPCINPTEPDTVLQEKCGAVRAVYLYKNIDALIRDLNMPGVGGVDALSGTLPAIAFSALSNICAYAPELTPQINLYVYRTPNARVGQVYMTSWVSAFPSEDYKGMYYDQSMLNIAVRMAQDPSFGSQEAYGQVFAMWLQGRTLMS
jgi:hypothetical protein